MSHAHPFFSEPLFMTVTSSFATLAYTGNHNTGKTYNVRRIICLGRNYAEHAKEMGHDPSEAPPFFFYKPTTALLAIVAKPDTGTAWEMPHYSSEVHHELELAIAIGKKVTAKNPEQGIIAAGIALDMTCRDIQQQAKQAGRPWETAKGFDHSAPCSTLFHSNWADLQKLGDFTLTKNTHEVQRGNIHQMIWSIPALLTELLKFTALDNGDLILTGTPAGVGPVKSGDELLAKIEGTNCQLHLKIK